MATTTNYGWTTPDDTDLVKDGAAAIRTLGSSIDTSFVADQGDLLLGGASDIFEPLAIGAADTVLTSNGTTASWAAPAASGGLIFINTTTFSAVSSQSVNDVFSASYKNYLVQFNMSGSTTNTDVDFRLRVAGADNSSSNYYRSSIFQSSSTITSQRLSAQTQWNGIAEVATGVQSAAQINIFNPFATQYTSALQQNTAVVNGNITQSIRSYGTDVTTSYTGFTIIPVSGTITGSLSVYGYNN